MLKKIVSFGARHGNFDLLNIDGTVKVIPGAVVIDVRKQFKNPYHDKRLRKKRGTDFEVQQDIMKTPEFDAKYIHLREKITVPGTEIAYIGCTGGHHRSVFLAEKLGKELGVPVEHRDIDKP